MIRDNIKFIFGPSVTTLFQPTWESLKGADAIVVTASTLASTLIGKPEAKHLFWSKVPDQGESGAITLNARALIERWKPKTAAVLLPADPAGQVHHDTYIKEFKAAGVNVVYEDTFEGTTQDFAPFITKIKDANPDVVVFGYLDRWGTPFLDQAAAAGLTSPHFAMSPGTTFAALKDRTTLSAALSMPTRVVDNADDAQLADWRKAYKDEFGSDPVPNDFWMLSYYDTVRMLAKAMTIANSMTDLDAITAAMKTPQAGDYPVRALQLTYDSKGGATYPQQNVFFEKGKVEYVDLKG
jgi:branched-chain amino acid transport system substrate-binding protein